MSTTTTTVTASKPNVGVYTDPEHKLWVADAKPSKEDVADGKDLQVGEVYVKVRSTGICGFVLQYIFPTQWLRADTVQLRYPLLACRRHRPHGRTRHPHPWP